MKKYLLFCSIISVGFMMTSFSGGFGAQRNQGSTGAPGESGQTCSRPGCHASGAFTPSLAVALFDDDGNPVTEYIPSETYTLTLKINTTGLPGGYGFQMVCLEDATENAVNTFADFQTGIGDIMIGDRQYVEHNRRLPSDSLTMTWTAPDNFAGDVTFYVSGQANNGNGSSAGDGATNDAFTFSEANSSSVSDVRALPAAVYPNPVATTLTIPSEVNLQSAQVIDIQGKLVLSTTAHQIDMSDLESGTYTLLVTDHSNNVYRERVQKL